MSHRLLTTAVLVTLAIGLTACPHPRPRPRPRPVATPVLAGRLQLPPDGSARQAFVTLQRRAHRGDGGAAWAVAHYLLDVYDYARLTGAREARRWLWAALGLPGRAQRGPQATARVIAALLQQARPPAASTRSAAAPASPSPRPAPRGGAAARWRALRALLTSDRDFQARRVALPARVKALRRLKRGPLRYAALLRLYSPCAQAFRAAVLAPPAARPRILNYCLVSLYEIDPTPHLRTHGAPPNPPWTAYRRGLRALLDAMEGAGARPAVTVARLRAQDRRFFTEQSHRLPLVVSGLGARLVPLSGGRRWSGGAAILRLEDQFITGGKVVVRPQKRHFRVALSRLFFANGRRTHLTVFAPGLLATGQLTALLERAADVGFYTVGLGGARRLARRVGYWRLTEQPPQELREVVISLAPSSEAARTLKNLPVKTLRWDARCARHGLGLVLRREAVVPTGPDGQLEPIAAAEDLGAAAVQAAAALQGAFPGACGLWLAPQRDVTFAQLIAVVTALRQASRPDVRAFRYLGLRLAVPKPAAGGGIFARRVQARRAATVKVLGLARRYRAHRAALAQAVRPCYLDALDENPGRWARLSVQSTPDKTLVNQVRGTSPEEVSLNECVAAAVSEWRKAQGLLGLVQLQLRLKP